MDDETAAEKNSPPPAPRRARTFTYIVPVLLCAAIAGAWYVFVFQPSAHNQVRVVPGGAHDWTNDGKMVFVRGQAMDIFDPKTFELYADSVAALSKNESGYSVYARDKKNIYFINFGQAGVIDRAQIKIIAGADPKTFAPISTPGFTQNGEYTPPGATQYAKDATHVFWQDEVLIGADPRTFVIIPSRTTAVGYCATGGIFFTGYASDYHNTYCRDRIIPKP